MKLLVIVTTSPWAGSRADAALRFVVAARQGGHLVPAVYFREDGVYHALRGRLSDGGQAQPSDRWLQAAGSGTALLLCTAAAQRRFPQLPAEQGRFRECGLAEVWSIAADCDRVLTF